MSVQHLCARLIGVLGGKQQRTRRSDSVKLQVEPLENRVVPTLLVNLVNKTGMPDNAISVVMAGGLQHYDGTSWVSNPSGSFVTSTKFSDFSGVANHQAAVTIPDGLDGGFSDFFLGTDVRLVSAANQRVGSPSPYDNQPGKPGVSYPQFQEAEFSTDGAGNTKFAIDISNVDQWSMPVQLSLKSSTTTFGITATQASMFDKFNSGLTGAFQNIIIKAGGKSVFVANPRKFLDAGPGGATSPLNQYFDADLKSLFETGTNNIDLTVSGVTWTGTREPDPSRPGAFRLKYSNSTKTVYVYEPGLNGIANPSWNDAAESSGKQVFGGDGVFNDAGRQAGGAADVGALADIEQQINAALNRGVASLNSSQWLSYANQYKSGSYNQYAKILHDNSIGNKAYGFSEDEQSFSSKFDFLPMPDTATISLGPLSSSLGTRVPPVPPVPPVFQELFRRVLAALGFLPLRSMLDRAFAGLGLNLPRPKPGFQSPNRNHIDKVFADLGRNSPPPKPVHTPPKLLQKFPHMF